MTSSTGLSIVIHFKVRVVCLYRSPTGPQLFTAAINAGVVGFYYVVSNLHFSPLFPCTIVSL